MTNNNVIVKIAHRSAACAGLITAIMFFASTLVAELLGDPQTIVLVKTRIFYALPIMVVAMFFIAFSGNSMGNKRIQLVQQKLARMKIIAGTGMLLILLATASYYTVIKNGPNGVFTILQVFELGLGLFNIINMLKMVRDGLKLSGRIRPAFR